MSTYGAALVDFDEHDSKYKCCCTACHSTTGVKVVCFVGALGVLVHVVSSISSGESVLFSVAWLLLAIGVLGCSVYAVYAIRAVFLVPQMVLQVIAIAVFLLLVVCCTAVAVLGGEFVEQLFKLPPNGTYPADDVLTSQEVEELQTLQSQLSAFGPSGITTLLALLAVFYGLAALFEIWCFTIFLSAFRYLHHKSAYLALLASQPVAPSSAPPQSQSFNVYGGVIDPKPTKTTKQPLLYPRLNNSASADQ